MLPSFALGIILLSFNIFTLTFTSHHYTLRYLRLFLALPTCLFWFSAAYPNYWPEDTVRGNMVTTCSLGLYGLMKTLDVCVVGFLELEGPKDVPRWMKLKREGREEGITKQMLPLPTSLKGRLAYTVDSLLSVKGASCFPDTVWDWALQDVVDYRPSPRYIPFILDHLKWITINFLIVDASLHIITTPQWNTSSPYPLTFSTRSPIAQVAWTFIVGAFPFFGMGLQSRLLSLILVPAFRLPTSAWPPMFKDPLSAYSLSDFWGRRWHGSWARVFGRLSLPFLCLLRPLITSTRMEQFVKAVVIFTISLILHLVLPFSLPREENPHLTFINPGYVWFFLAQPFGLLLEALVVKPLTERLPGKQKVVARRVWLWSWLIWTGRWYADAALRIGQLDRNAIQGSPFLACMRAFGLGSLVDAS